MLVCMSTYKCGKLRPKKKKKCDNFLRCHLFHRSLWAPDFAPPTPLKPDIFCIIYEKINFAMSLIFSKSQLEFHEQFTYSAG